MIFSKKKSVVYEPHPKVDGIMDNLTIYQATSIATQTVLFILIKEMNKRTFFFYVSYKHLNECMIVPTTYA
jgi:alpha/beta superfamily hydrolase